METFIYNEELDWDTNWKAWDVPNRKEREIWNDQPLTITASQDLFAVYYGHMRSPAHFRYLEGTS